MGEEFVSDDEFHETFEDITSTSGSDSADEGSAPDDDDDNNNNNNNNRIMRGGATRVAPHVVDLPLWTPSSFQSKFSVWKDDPSSINERRQRFFKQMGLRGLRDEPLNGHVALLTGAQKLGAEDEPVSGFRVKVTCEKCGGKRKGAALLAQDCAHVENLGREVVAWTSKSSPFENGGCKSTALENGVVVQGNRRYDDQEVRFSDERATATTGEGESEPGFDESSGRGKCFRALDQKTCDCAESAGGSDCVYNNSHAGNGRAGLKRSDSESSSSLDDDGLRFESGQQQHHHQASSSQEKFDVMEMGSSACSSPQRSAMVASMMEERLKIRDLDSGKEFLMKRFNRDGSLNTLREVATGKDLTLAEFEKTLGLFSPVAQELHRRERTTTMKPEPTMTDVGKPPPVVVFTKRKSWLKKLKGALKTTTTGGSKDGGSIRSASARTLLDTSSQRSVDDNNADDTSSQVGSLLSGEGSPKRDSSFAGLDRSEFTRRGTFSRLLPTDADAAANAGDGSFWRKPQKVKVKLRQKSSKELSDLHLSQEIVAHQGAIWTMKFSPDGRYLASAGQDRVVHVWEVIDHPLMAESDVWNGSEKGSGELGNEGSVKAGQARSMTKVEREGSFKGGKGTPRKHNPSKGPVPKLFWLSEKPMCSFRGHTEDILDLSWSRSQFLLSSSMDNTVRLWHISYDECLRVFSHNDYVTCAQFNPLDDRYFLSGSIDDRVRIWSIPEHHVVDWNDLQEMVTAVCYTPDGKKAIVGSYKGTCRFYNATGNKLQLDAHIDVRENKKARGKKITGLHCMPGDPQKVLVTSNDSRVRVYDGLNLVAKYKGLRNVKSQISSSFSPAGDFIISASEDSRVLVWNSCNQDVSNKTSIYRRDKQLSCEEFTARHVSVAIAWPGSSTTPLSSTSSATRAAASEPLVVARGSDEFGSATYANNNNNNNNNNKKLESSPPREAGVLATNGLVVPTKGSDEHAKCPSYCLGRSPLGIFGSGRKNSVAVADELTSTKQHGHHHLDAATATPPPPAAAGSSPPVENSSAKVSVAVSVSVQASSLDACESSPPQRRASFFPECGPKGSATWPEEKLGAFAAAGGGASLVSAAANGTPLQPPPPPASIGGEMGGGGVGGGGSPPPVDLVAVSPAWGLVIVTAGLGGEITTFQNYGFPVRL